MNNITGRTKISEGAGVSNRIEMQIQALLDALRMSEQEEKKRYDAAIDIEDMAEATAVTIEARTKIQQLRKWTEDVFSLQKEISASYVAAETVVGSTTSTPVIQEPKHSNKPETEESSADVTLSASASEYVRQKLHQLSKSGFSFSDEQLRNIQDYAWCRNNLRLPHPLARVYDENKNILEQTAISGAPRRYWVKERFRFGDVTLLIYSGWASLYIPYFDKWYESLVVGNASDNASSAVVTISKEQLTIPAQKKDNGATPDNPEEFSLFGTVYVWRSWDDILVKLCEEMILKNPYKTLGIGVKKSATINGLPILWYSERDELEQAHKLSNGLSLVKNITGNDIISYCERILNLCDYNRNELKIR